MIPHEDKVDVIIYLNQHIAHRGWRNLIPHGDIVYVIHPNQHIVQRGWRILTPHENKDDNYDDGDDDDDDHDHDHDDCKCGATSGLGRRC